MSSILPPAPEDLDAEGRDMIDLYALDRVYLHEVLDALGLPDIHAVFERMRARNIISDVEELDTLDEINRSLADSHDALIRQVRDDVLAGRLSPAAAIERVGLTGWTEICASLDHETLRRILGGAA